MQERAGLSNEQRAEIEALEKLPDGEVDTADTPEVLDWSNATRGVLYRPASVEGHERLE